MTKMPPIDVEAAIKTLETIYPMLDDDALRKVQHAFFDEIERISKILNNRRDKIEGLKK